MPSRQFDAETYLKERGIDYLVEGKNVSNGWIEVQCPFCGDDPSMHLGISPERRIHCWRCGVTGDIKKYIKQVEDCSWNDASKIVRKFLDETIQYYPIENKASEKRSKTELPKNLENLSEVHYRYLENRNFDPIIIERKYKLKALGRSVRNEDKLFQYRIIIPIVMGGTIVNFVARDFTGKRSPKYVNQENKKAMLPTKNCLYNIDSVRDIILIVEGVTDVWRMGNGAVATMGTGFTTRQINQIIKRQPKKCFVMFDPEPNAQQQAEKLSHVLSNFMVTTILELDTDDPANLTQKEADSICKEIGLK